MNDRDRLILEDPEKMCEYCCNFDKEHIRMDGTALCKLTMTLAYAEDYGGNCMFYNVPKERIIVPPCKVGDMVYQIKYCRCGNPENYEVKHCHKKEVKNTPKVYGSIMLRQDGKRLKKSNNWFEYPKWEWRPIGTICYKIIKKPFKLEWITNIGKTVFLTKEEAEKALKEREGNG